MHQPLFWNKSLSSIKAPSRPSSPFRLDEGYSEDPVPPSPDSLDANISDELLGQIKSAREWLMSQPVDLRADLACDLLGSLPNSIISDIVREANNRLHFDPVLCLPHEIALQVFAEFDAATLLKTSSVSKSWRAIAFQPPLWRKQFRGSGWTYNHDNLRTFEDNSRLQVSKIWSNPRVRSRPADLSLDSARVKRQRSDNPERSSNGQRLWVAQSALNIPERWLRIPAEHGAFASSPLQNDASSAEVTLRGFEESATGPQSSTRSTYELEDFFEQTVCPLLNPSRLVDTQKESPRMNWQWLFKQRHRLEQNWDRGRFTNFRLPHTDYPQEGHTECVYTLQFSQKYLVSGSRDKSVRVWDLERQRLKLSPLLGHNGSVLCLQFDESPSRDLIASGSSDSDVIIWRFSTGAMVVRLHQAHRESVLNLQFDDRYLVTCSKDHTIKLWNIRSLLPTDPEYPNRNKTRNASYPDHIINVEAVGTDLMAKPSEPLPGFTHLMTFTGHGAAVNAIHMCGNFIVSASGDRKIMLWDIKEGSLVRIFSGHTKGIACVQYDGRRIVSGSNDKTVRIFDSATGAEVALLNSHTHLVRTVQAEFGDMFDSEELLEAEARANDRMLLDAEENGSAAGGETISRHFVFGAKLPPGGGGNRWSKIVSGSYDQSVMIWRRDKVGKWMIAQELRHDDALEQSITGGPADRAGVSTYRDETLLQRQHHLRVQAQQLQRRAQTPGATIDGPQNSIGTGRPSQGFPNLGHAHGSRQHHQHDRASRIPSQAPQATPLLDAPQVVGPVNLTQPNPPAHAGGTQRAQRVAMEAAEREASRVFKLQFDARRIISSSSVPVIVGWDFANGDRDIEEASQFFGEPA